MTLKGKSVTIGSLAAAAVLIGGVVTTLDVPLPRPAWSTDIQRLAGEVASVKRLALRQAIESDELRWARLRGEAQGYRDRGQPVPNWLTVEIRTLERRIREYEAELETLR